MMRRETLLILGHGVIGQGQLCPPPPPHARGCHALRCLVDIGAYSAIRMDTILLRYSHSIRTKCTKNPNANYAVKAEISMKTISFGDSVTPLGFSAG